MCDSGKLAFLPMHSPWSQRWQRLINPLPHNYHPRAHAHRKQTNTFWREIEVAVSVAGWWGAMYQGSNWDGRWKAERGSDNHPHTFLAAVQLYPAASTTSWTPITASKALLVRDLSPLPLTLPPSLQQLEARNSKVKDNVWCPLVPQCVRMCVRGGAREGRCFEHT